MRQEVLAFTESRHQWGDELGEKESFRGYQRRVWQLICGMQDRVRYVVLLRSDTKAVPSKNYHFLSHGLLNFSLLDSPGKKALIYHASFINIFYSEFNYLFWGNIFSI